jgi:limonene-1,2-epoxide hydrolase
VIVGNREIKWDMGYDAAVDVLTAIQTVIDNPGFSSVKGEEFHVELREDAMVVTIAPDFWAQ